MFLDNNYIFIVTYITQNKQIIITKKMSGHNKLHSFYLYIYTPTSTKKCFIFLKFYLQNFYNFFLKVLFKKLSFYSQIRAIHFNSQALFFMH